MFEESGLACPVLSSTISESRAGGRAGVQCCHLWTGHCHVRPGQTLQSTPAQPSDQTSMDT